MRDYGKVHWSFWTSPDIREMSEDARSLALYLLTTGHGNLLGAFRLPYAYVSDDMQWRFERVSKGFAELYAKGFASGNDTAKWVLIARFLKWNPLENANQAKCAMKLFEQVPNDSGIKLDVLKALKEFCPSFDWPNEEPFRNGYETLSKSVTVTVTVPVTVDTESVSADAKRTLATDKTDDLPAIAEWCVKAWTRCKAAKGLKHWPDARTPRNLSRLSARRKEFGNLEEFRAAFIDRLQRMSAAYATLVGDSWAPSLRWLLDAHGWELSAEKLTPEQLAQAPRKNTGKLFTKDDPLLGHLYGNEKSDGSVLSFFARGVPSGVQAVEPSDGGGMGRGAIEVPGRTVTDRRETNGANGGLPNDGGFSQDPRSDFGNLGIRTSVEDE